MTDQARRAILEAVAAGRLDPSDAADKLADLDAPAETAASDPPSDNAASRVVERRIESIKVDGSFRSIEIVGDDSVREAVAEGPHRVRWEGDVLVIDGSGGMSGVDDLDEDDDTDDEEFDGFGDWFRVTGPRHLRRARHAYGWDHGQRHARPLRVRMNPDLPLEARVEAGPLTIRRVRGPVKARVAAGPLVIEGFESPIDLRVAAGKVSARGRLDSGISTIDCDAGKVSLHLQTGSDVRVSASATLGKVDVGSHHVGGRDRARRAERFVRDRDGSDFGERIVGLLNNAFSDEHEVILGRGNGELDVRVSMGSADITFDDQPSS